MCVNGTDSVRACIVHLLIGCYAHSSPWKIHFSDSEQFFYYSFTHNQWYFWFILLLSSLVSSRIRRLLLLGTHYFCARSLLTIEGTPTTNYTVLLFVIVNVMSKTVIGDRIQVKKNGKKQKEFNVRREKTSYILNRNQFLNESTKLNPSEKSESFYSKRKLQRNKKRDETEEEREKKALA